MANQSYEIEIKSLLGSKENADALIAKMKSSDKAFQVLGSHKQLNHYFTGGSLEKVHEKFKDLIAPSKKASFEEICSKGKDFSLRTRLADKTVILVIKASVDDTTSSNGTARMEFENIFTSMTLEELDAKVVECGFEYQAKWSRERSEYKFRDANVSIDKNAGYGYLSEFEMISDNPSHADELKSKIRLMMDELGVVELPQDRLARMFDFYNKNWQNYYGTDNTFTVE